MSRAIEEETAAIAERIRSLAEALAGKTVLISGGAGFLGRFFVETIRHVNTRILRDPCRVISVDNYITGERSTIVDPNVLSVWGDVTQPLPMREPVDYVIHAAGLASPFYYQQYPLETIESAVIGAKNLLELAHQNGLKGFLLFSSSEIYGDPGPAAVPTPETYCGNVSSIGPRACYDESKRLAETIALTYHQRRGVPVKIVRPFNIYGPGMRADDYRVVPTFARKVLNGEPIPVHGDGHQTRTFTYVTDAMVGFFQVLLAGQPGEVYNVGNDEGEISMRDLAQLLVELSGSPSRVETIPYPETYPAGEPQRRLPDLTKIRRELGYAPTVPLRDGLRRFLAWASAEPSYVRAAPVTAAVPAEARAA